MNIVLQLLFSESLFLISIGIIYFLVNKRLKNFEDKIDKVYKRLDSIFTVDPVSTNEATKEDKNLSDVSEQNILPNDIKFEIANDENVPPGFEVNKN